jgi:CzcA family heavy metal efflux pump
MMRRIIESSLRARHLIVAIAAVMMVFGVKQLRDAPVDALPEFEPPLVEVQTEALGLSASEVEALITLNLEELLSGVSWLKTIRSQSVPGLSSIVMVFEPGTDVMRARQLVQERLTLAYTLPNVSKPPAMIQPLSAASRFMIVGLSSKTVSPIQMSVLTRWTIKPRLLGVRGVANVAVWGDRDRQLQVQLNPQTLAERRVSQEQLIRTAGDALWVSPLTFLNASFPGTGGWIDTPNQRLGIQHFLPISTPEDMARIPVEGATMRLGEVARVVEGHAPLIGDAILKDDTPGLLLVLEKFPGTNTLQVTRDVEKALAALRAGLPGVEIDADIYRAASYIESGFGNLDKVWAIGGVLLLVVLVAAFFHVRVALISLVAIPLALLTAGLVLHISGATINMMILAGLVVALGVIVADAVVDVENMVRRLQRPAPGDSEKSTARIVAEASLETRGPMTYALLITLLTVLPIVVMQGMSGAFFKPLALAYAVAVVSSMFVALTITPALAVLLLRSGFADERESPLAAWLRGRYDAAVARTVEAPRLAFVAAGVIAIVGFGSWNWLGQSLVPSFKERHVLIDWVGAPGASQPAMSRIMSRAGRELRAIPGVTDVGAHVGRAVTGDQVVGINSAQLWVAIDPQADYDGTVAAIREVAAGYPGLDGNVQTYLTERVREVMTGTDRPLVVRLFGPRRDVLAAKAEEIKGLLSQIQGITDLQVEGQVEEPQVEIKVNLAAAEPYGLKPGDIRRQAATVFAGLGVGVLFEEQKVFDVVVWGAPETRQSLTNIRELLLETPRGRPVRLGEIADVRLAASPTVIQHERISPRIDVVANIGERDLPSVVDQVEDRLENFKFPIEYHAEVVGETVAREEAERQLIAVVIAAAIGILLLLQAAFGSWRLAVAFFLTLPTALAGGLLGTWADGGILTLGSFLGLLAVVGIATRDGILLIKRYQRLEEREGVPFGPALVQRGTREQLVSILLTAAATAAILVPLVALGDIAGLEIVHPMAVVMLAGLITSTVVTLTVVPALYLRFGGKREPELELSPATP